MGDLFTSPPAPSQKGGDILDLGEKSKVLKAFLHDDSYIITQNQDVEIAKWGLIPFWVRDVKTSKSIRNRTANARTENVFSTTSFREAIKKRRCLIPSTGFYEYHHEENEAIPYRIFLPETEIFSLAGIYDEWQNPETGEYLRTFSVLTCKANRLCGRIHNGGKNPGRMPVILRPEDEEIYLNPDLTKDGISGLFVPFEDSRMEAYPLDMNYLRA
ncbi:MAG: SOS response-associated peptidase [Tannerella sp.]|jgi:putative SOS response-associated peptidase YedK|nr:SOS response-associated peptidase [Tannerella sp.]